MSPGEDSPRRVVVIGSGIGGLSTAIIMAGLGFSVTVIEKNDRPGGLMRGYRRGGVECPVGVHYIGAMGEGQPLRRVFDYLGLTGKIPMERAGADGVIDRYIFDDLSFDLPTGIGALEEKLHASFPAEKKAIEAVIKNLRETEARLNSLDFLFNPFNDLSVLDQFLPVDEALARLGCTAPLRRVIGVASTLLGVPAEECPQFFHHMTLVSFLMSAWRLRSGGIEMAEAFVQRLTELGGSLRCGDGVARVLVDSRTVGGVELASGERIAADTVVAAIHPRSMLGMMGEGDLPPAYRRRVGRIADTMGIFSSIVGVDASAIKEISHNVYRLHAGSRGEIAEGSFFQVRGSGKEGMNLLIMMTRSDIAQWRAWEHTTSGRRGEDYLLAKRECAEGLMEEAREVFGPLKGAREIDSYTPLSIRDWVGSPGGSAYGVLRSSAQLTRAAALNRIPVKGLFLAGQSAMAPGVFGTALGSFATVRGIIGHERFCREVRF